MAEPLRRLAEGARRRRRPPGDERREAPGSGRCRTRHRLKAAAAPARPGSEGPAANMTSSDKEFPEDSSFSPKASTSKLPTDASPDSKCPICLDRFDNVAYLDRCLHRFCFRCVQEWSKNKAECPLCKQPFFSIFHTIRAEDDFKEYVLSPSENSSFASPDGQRFRYRTTLTGERRTVSSSSRRTLSPPDNGILFEGLSSEPVRQRDGEIQQMIRRLASRRQASAEGRSLRQIQEEDMINFRRALYRTGVRIRSIQDGGRYRDISAEFFRHNPACLHRLVPWLKRELTVLFGAHGSLVNIVQHIIMSNVTRYDLESQAFADDLKPFLLNRTEHFLHEFISFARCPFNLEAYDQHANYDCPAPSYDEGSHSDSSIITISPDVAYSQGPDNSLSVTGLDHAPWDDETPGPSYSISEEVRTTIASPLETSESSDDGSASKSRRTKLQTRLQANVDSNDSDSSSDNCVIVGYVKPLAERTPEVVELSSDSEESIREEKRETVKKQQPIQCRSWSDSEPSRSFSPHSPTYKEGVGSCRSCLSPAIEKTESKDGNKNKYKVKGLSHRDLSWSPSPGSDTVCSPWNHRLSRKGKSRSPQSCSRYSRSSHGHRSRREHRSKHQLKRRQSRSRDSSKHRSKRSSRKSRAHDTRVSLKSQRGSLSHESTPSREVSRSRSRSEGHGKRRSRSRDSDRYYVRDNYQSKYQWGYAFCSRKVFGDGYESSSRRRTQSNALYSRQSASPEYRIRSFVERTDPHSQKGLHERQYYCYERCRSRSRSSNRSRTPSGGTDRMKSEKPGGKRKYKTRHLESAFKETTSLERENDPKKTSSKFSDCYKSEDSLSDNRASSETKRKKKKKKMRSPSVEIVYEGKATDTTRHLKKKKKKHKKKHRKHHTSNSAHSSPVVITIDSDSSKEPESTECDSSITWMDRTQINERENESPSSFLGRTGCEDVYKVGEETGGAAKKYSVPTRKGDLDGDMRNADVKLRDSSITWMGRTQINERENESPSSFLGRTGCEDVYKVGEETGGAAKKYSVPTRKGDLDGDMRNADVKLRDSSITWMGRTQINERENESPSSFLGRTGCEDVYKVGEETGGAAKKYSVPTRKGDLDGDMRNADVKLRETAADRSLSIVDTSSNTPHTETVTSYIQEAPAAPSSQLPSPRISFLECPERQPLMLRLPKGLVNRSSWFDFPEEEM
ncbi:E3 ubiquitin-protein ligase Topors [Grus americana]|uniref:E3 ubiquitin-protein ligase Topors n=1 Tax=Grus americana TaxID=9117 RepID=UPI0024084168|nr:E3 ubiquitin-protein ligase Topors [Grus americana]